MGGNIYSQYNNEKNMTINIESNKVCYFPGEIMYGTITLFPFMESFQKILDNPKLNITITELKRYSYSTGGKHKHTVIKEEENNLVGTTINFGNFVSMDSSKSFQVPFSIPIPIYTYPSINFFYNGYVKHFIIVELPDIQAKRTKMFVVKNILPNNLDNSLLRNMIEENKEYKKSKLFFGKGSCLLNIKIPKNYFFYNEKIPFEVNIDYTNLKMEIKSIKVSLRRNARKNNYQDYSEVQRNEINELNKKNYNLEKGLNNFHISDFLEFPTSSDYNSVYPPNVYLSFEEHGLTEVNDTKFEYNLFPSTINGLVSVDYFIALKIYFDSLFTFNEELLIPIYFCVKPENNYSMNPMIIPGDSSSIASTKIDNSINTNFAPK